MANVQKKLHIWGRLLHSCFSRCIQNYTKRQKRRYFSCKSLCKNQPLIWRPKSHSPEEFWGSKLLVLALHTVGKFWGIFMQNVRKLTYYRQLAQGLGHKSAQLVSGLYFRENCEITTMNLRKYDHKTNIPL